jgi:uncharacterized protein (DUF58 family)
MARFARLRALFRYAPTRRYAWLIAGAAPVWLGSGSGVGLAIAATATVLLLLAGLADALAIPGRPHMRVDRTLPDSVGLGDAAAARYRIRSAWPLRADLDVHDALVPGVERTSPAAGPANVPWLIGAARVPARGSANVTVAFTGRKRGEYAAGPVVLRVRGPLGLVQRSIDYDAGGTLAVIPSIAGVRRYRLLALQHRLRDAGIRTIRRRGDGMSFANLREYVEGDDPRHIDWKASARRGKLISREYTVEQGQTVLILIDAGRMMTQLSDRVPRFEHALAAATVLADVATRSGDHVGLLVFDDMVRAFVPPAKGAFALRSMREAMVPLRATMTEPDYAGAFRTLAARHRRRSLLVLFTDVVDPSASRALIAHTMRSAARHLPLVVALQNDELMETAQPREGGAAAVYQSAAAEELLQERAEALARMRRAGVSVLDVSPRVMTIAVVNRYLAIKARASL